MKTTYPVWMAYKRGRDPITPEMNAVAGSKACKFEGKKQVDYI